jgi:hypothetical protein
MLLQYWLVAAVSVPFLGKKKERGSDGDLSTFSPSFISPT